MGASVQTSHFKRVVQFDTYYSPTKITKYQSSRTGLSSIVVDRTGPKICGYFTLATEILDDSGAPHTLEHLVFLGSKNYRYKGLLDKLANRAYSSTNAWTATDHTAYQLETAGWEGFAQILPVYLEHILLPTITDAGCYTEVHHVDGTGQDAGVVYSEMQGVENNSDSLMNLRAYRHLYPKESGFRYETGGMTPNLRVLTTQRIREFHKEMYQPNNLCVIVIGEVDHSDLLKILDEFEDSILDDFPAVQTTRPWVDSPPIPPLTNSIVDTVDFPEKDESMGEVLIAWLGPDCTDPVASSALAVFDSYLAGSSVSVLENHFVEITEPKASTVSLSVEERPNSVIWITLYSVPTKKLAEVEKEVIEVLKKTASEPLNMEYLKDCLRRAKRKIKFYADLSGVFFNQPIISDFLFGKTDGSTLKDLQSLKAYDELEKWSDTDWREFLRRWISDAHHISILGRPSATLVKRIKEEESARIETRKRELGEGGLKKLAQQLEDAKAENDRPIPQEVIDKFRIPGVESIHFIPTTTARAGFARQGGIPNNIQKLLDQNPATSTIPLYLHFEHVPTSFVHIHVILSTSGIPVELRPLLAVYDDNFFNTPVMKNGKRMEYEMVVAQLEKFTVRYAVGLGDRIGVGESVHIMFQIEPEHYALTIEWLRTLLWDSIFDEKRLKVSVSKLLQDIPEEKRRGEEMTNSVGTQITTARDSIGRATDTLVKASYLLRIAKLLDIEPDTVIHKMDGLREALCQAENMRILVVADAEKLPNPVAAWARFVEDQKTTKKPAKLDRKSERLSPAGLNPGHICQIVPLQSIDSSYSIHIAKGPKTLLDPNLPALILALAYLQTIEGPLWTSVRGSGLAYGSYFSRNTDSGHLTFSIYRAPDAYKAFAAAKEIIMGYVNGTTLFDKHLLEGALSSIVVKFADTESDMASAAIQSFINQVIHGVEKDWNTVLLKNVQAITEEDLRKVLKDVVMGCFEEHRCISVCVAAEPKAETIKKGFLEEGFTVSVDDLEKFQDSYGLEVQGVVDTKGGSDRENEDEDKDEVDESGSEDEGPSSEEEE